MYFEHNGFRVTTEVVADSTDTQWVCQARIEGVTERTRDVQLPAAELSIPKLKIDVLMAMSMVEHKARDTIDAWVAQQPAA
jgi:hypothetical protein